MSKTFDIASATRSGGDDHGGVEDNGVIGATSRTMSSVVAVRVVHELCTTARSWAAQVGLTSDGLVVSLDSKTSPDECMDLWLKCDRSCTDGCNLGVWCRLQERFDARHE